MQNKLTIEGKSYLVLEVEGVSPVDSNPPVIVLTDESGEKRYMSTFSFLDKYWWIHDKPLEKGVKINIDKDGNVVEIITRKTNETY